MVAVVEFSRQRGADAGRVPVGLKGRLLGDLRQKGVDLQRQVPDPASCSPHHLRIHGWTAVQPDAMDPGGQRWGRLQDLDDSCDDINGVVVEHRMVPISLGQELSEPNSRGAGRRMLVLRAAVA